MYFLVYISIVHVQLCVLLVFYHVWILRWVCCPELFFASDYSVSRAVLDANRPSLRMWSWKLVFLCPLHRSVGVDQDMGWLMCERAS